MGIVVVQLAVIYGLVNRLIRQAGQRPMSVSDVLEKTVTSGKPPEPVGQRKAMGGSQRITN